MVRLAYFIVIAISLAVCVSGCQPAVQSADQPFEDVFPTVDEQKAELLRQIEARYESPAAHYQLGKLYHADGLYEKAEFEYRVALGFDPVNHRAQAGIVKSLQDQGKSAKAQMAAAEYMAQAAVSAETALRLGQAFQAAGLGEYALAGYQQGLNLAPDSAALYREIGYHYLAKSDPVRAEENLRQSFQLDPYQPDVAEELGRMGVMVQIPPKPENFIQKLFKEKETAPEEPSEDYSEPGT
jgi:tetratricopeptide (TPR) repeat protein